MEETYGSLRPDRPTSSYALEFLRTERANGEQAYLRNKTYLAAQSLSRLLKHCTDQINMMADAVSRIDQNGVL